MRYMIIVKATKDSEAGAKPEEKLFHDMATHHEDLARAGVPNPAGAGQPCEIEVRQLFSLDDFEPGSPIERFRALGMT